MFQVRRAGTKQHGEVCTVTPGVGQKHTPLPFDLPSNLVLSIWNMANESAGWMAWYGTAGESHVSMRQNVLQSRMSLWKRIRALMSSRLLSRDWALVSRTMGRGGRCALARSLFQTPACFQRCYFLLQFHQGPFPLLRSVFCFVFFSKNNYLPSTPSAEQTKPWFRTSDSTLSDVIFSFSSLFWAYKQLCTILVSPYLWDLLSLISQCANHKDHNIPITRQIVVLFDQAISKQNNA